MNITVEVVGAIVGVVLGIAAILGGVYRFWSLPDRVKKLEDGREEDQKSSSADHAAIARDFSARHAALAAEVTDRVNALRNLLDEHKTSYLSEHHKSRAELFARINDLQAQVTSNKLDFTTSMAALREIQNSVKEKLQVFERLETSVSSALMANAEKKAEIDRLKDDYQKLEELLQRLNREIGEMRGESREIRKRS